MDPPYSEDLRQQGNPIPHSRMAILAGGAVRGWGGGVPMLSRYTAQVGCKAWSVKNQLPRGAFPHTGQAKSASRTVLLRATTSAHSSRNVSSAARPQQRPHAWPNGGFFGAESTRHLLSTTRLNSTHVPEGYSFNLQSIYTYFMYFVKLFVTTPQALHKHRFANAVSSRDRSKGACPVLSLSP